MKANFHGQQLLKVIHAGSADYLTEATVNFLGLLMKQHNFSMNVSDIAKTCKTSTDELFQAISQLQRYGIISLEK